MNRYWDLTPQQRAALTSEQVEALLDVELMEKGVAKAAPPQLVEEPDITLATSEFFEVQFEGDYGRPESSGWVFATADQAKQFIDAAPMERKSDYQTDYKAYVKPCRKMTIAPVQLPSEQIVLNQAAKLSKLKEAKAINVKARNEYAKACKVVEEAVSGVWNDWHEQRSAETAALEVAKTRDEYRTLCDGNEEIAEAFLRKVYSENQIQAADEWLECTALVAAVESD